MTSSELERKIGERVMRNARAEHIARLIQRAAKAENDFRISIARSGQNVATVTQNGVAPRSYSMVDVNPPSARTSG